MKLSTRLSGPRSLRRIAVVVTMTALAAALLVAARPQGETASVALRSLSRTAEIRGSLEAEDSLKFGPPAGIRSQWNFKISFMAPEGGVIEAGQPLLAFDSTELQTQLLEALSRLETAETNLEKSLNSSAIERENRDLAVAEAVAEANKAKLKVGAPELVVASKELQQSKLDLDAAEKKQVHLLRKAEAQDEQARNEIESLRSRVAQRKAKVDQLQSEIASLTIRAPSQGTVVYETNWRSEKKKVGDQANRMEKVVSLPNLKRLRATAQIDEVFAAEVAVGQRVTFTLDSFPDDQFEGKIRGINSAIQQRSRRDPRKALTVDIELVNADPERMRPGMRIQGELEILRTEPVPTLPIEAVFFENGEPKVRVHQGLWRWFKPGTETPEFGRMDDSWVEIKKGLAVGDRVLLPSSGSPSGNGGGLS